jgi:hypothetical protein
MANNMEGCWTISIVGFQIWEERTYGSHNLLWELTAGCFRIDDYVRNVIPLTYSSIWIDRQAIKCHLQAAYRQCHLW